MIASRVLWNGRQIIWVRNSAYTPEYTTLRQDFEAKNRLFLGTFTYTLFSLRDYLIRDM